MITELSEEVWSNPRFHTAAKQAELAWLRREVGTDDSAFLTDEDARKLLQAAAILACSEKQPHREAAFRAATCVFDLADRSAMPLDQALRVVLARLGNFPSFKTREEVNSALPMLPLSLVTEELINASTREVRVNEERLVLTDFQLDLWKIVAAKTRVALSAPTSAGKSFVLQNYLISLFAGDAPLSVVYLVPTRALITQVATDLAKTFRAARTTPPDIITIPLDAETALPDQAVYVLTQERTQLALAAHPNFKADVIVVDEAQGIAEGSRGVLLQWILDDLLARNAAAQILFASPNIRNLEIFGRLFGLTDIREMTTTEPTVAQNFLIVRVDSTTKGKLTICKANAANPTDLVEVGAISVDHTVASRLEKLVHIAAKFGRNHSNIVYANGADDAETIALQLADLFDAREPTPDQLALADLAKEVVHPNYALVECVKRGVAFHYSNMPTQLRRAVEDAVSSGHIDYLVCTSTLLQGVNLPVRNIFMCAPEKGRTRPLESTDFWNLSGRAGRLRREFQGNVFLIDYANWKKKPLEGPRDAVVVPAIEAAVRERRDQLVTVIENGQVKGRRDNPDLETAFVRLFADHKNGNLFETFERIGVNRDTHEATQLSEALANADREINLPAEIIRQTPNISAHKQQALYDRLMEAIANKPDAAARLIPRHPRESEAYDSYAQVLRLCHEIFLGIDTARNLHRFHALIALKWVRGIALPQIVDERIKRARTKSVRTTIRDTLELIETNIRFQTVRFFGCYNALLGCAFRASDRASLVESIPSLPLFLEVGASDRTMISFIALGLSRVAAMRLNEISARKDLDVAGALRWLQSRPLDTMGLSPLLLSEVRAITAAAAA